MNRFSGLVSGICHPNPSKSPSIAGQAGQVNLGVVSRVSRWQLRQQHVFPIVIPAENMAVRNIPSYL